MQHHENGLNRDGSFRATRVGMESLGLATVYSSMLTMSWLRFLLTMLGVYLIFSILFTAAYVSGGLDNIEGLTSLTNSQKFAEVFFYSAQTMTTVGGTGLRFVGFTNSCILTLEAMMALLYMSTITGLLFIRFSKPTTKIVISENAVIAPYKDGRGLMIRIANAKKNEIFELTVTLAFLDFDPVHNKRSVKQLKLENSYLAYAPVVWTIVHPITPESPFFDKQRIDSSEFKHNLVLYISAVDGVTGSGIKVRRAFSMADMAWDSKFSPCSEMTDDGEILLFLDKISDCQRVN
jgi:inward rectifier potassium channel